MQNIVIDKPYTFVPPRLSRFWLWVARHLGGGQLRRDYGITAVECRGAEHLRASLEAGYGVMLAANHCRPCDPLVLDSLAREVGRPFHTIASWHLFMESRWKRFMLPRIGAFSVYREGMDRESLKCSINTVAAGKAPLVIFAEGFITRSNDRLANFMEGPAFLARAAAKQRPDGKVVIHPVFIRYFFEGNLPTTVTPAIEAIENRLSWQPQTALPLLDRIAKVGLALLALKEIEHLQAPQQGSAKERLQRLVDHLLTPLEHQWGAGRHDGDTMARVKRLRTAMLPDLLGSELTEAERAARWRHLADLYLVQQLHCYPGDYIEQPTAERILETVERYEEDLTDVARGHPPLRAVITVGEAIGLGAARDRSQASDPLTSELRQRMEGLLEESRTQRRVTPTGF
ncbi:MAG: 1-acyl-sn-glycerol-3-phosphate acyltransferase [Verrucomicrobia bacterium]|nr:1-acyl-sn-glycerol-3-phosphate acyltransferase [Verrucomicrobiota bacterium]